MPSIPTVKTRLLLLSDTHFLEPTKPDLARQDLPFRNPLPSTDILIHSGDLTSTGLYSQHALAVSLLRSHPAELKLVIPGNHDVTLDLPFYTKRKPHMAGSEYPEDVAAIKALYTSPEAVTDGIRYLEEGVHTFEISNGARFTVYASAYTPVFCDWGFAYERDEDRFNDGVKPFGGVVEEQSLVPDFPGVDIMVTHGPPEGIRDLVVYTGTHVGCQHLRKAAHRAKPRLHVFGHIHEGWGAEMWKWRGVELLSHVQNQVDGKCVRVWDDNVSDEQQKDWVRGRGRFVDLSMTAGELGIVHGESTFFVNASIMNVNYRPVNAPWVVDLDLPLGKGAAPGQEAEQGKEA